MRRREAHILHMLWTWRGGGGSTDIRGTHHRIAPVIALALSSKQPRGSASEAIHIQDWGPGGVFGLRACVASRRAHAMALTAAKPGAST